MKHLTLVLLFIALAYAEDSFLEKQKHNMRKQKDLAAEVYKYTQKKGPIFIGKSTDTSIREAVESLNDFQEILRNADVDVEIPEIKLLDSTLIIDEPNPQAVRANPNPEYKIFPAIKTVQEWSDSKVRTFNQDCFYVFSECNFKGHHQKTCLNQKSYMLGFPFEIKSLAIPKGANLLIKGEDQHQIMLGENQNCLKHGYDFMGFEGELEFTYQDGTKQKIE